MEGIGRRHVFERDLCALLIQDPDKRWVVDSLVYESRCSPERTDEVLRLLERLGAVELFWDPPRASGIVHPLDARAAASRRCVRLTGDGDEIVRGVLAEARPRTVIGTLLSSGAQDAGGLWQAKRRERAWRRRGRRLFPRRGGRS